MDLRREFTAVIAKAEAADKSSGSDGGSGLMAGEEPHLQVVCLGGAVRASRHCMGAHIRARCQPAGCTSSGCARDLQTLHTPVCGKAAVEDCLAAMRVRCNLLHRAR